jgi:hypothetical protein
LLRRWGLEVPWREGLEGSVFVIVCNEVLINMKGIVEGWDVDVL